MDKKENESRKRRPWNRKACETKLYSSIERQKVNICRDGNPSHPNTSRQIRFRRGREPFALCSRKKVKVP